jgi:hypothetical protein
MNKEIKSGDKYNDGISLMRVIAVAEGYAMCRRKGCMPVIQTVKEVSKLMEVRS